MAAWMRSVREASPAAGAYGTYSTHSTLSWLQLAPTGAAFTPGLPVFEQASLVWRQGLLREQ